MPFRSRAPPDICSKAGAGAGGGAKGRKGPRGLDANLEGAGIDRGAAAKRVEAGHDGVPGPFWAMPPVPLM